MTCGGWGSGGKEKAPKHFGLWPVPVDNPGASGPGVCTDSANGTQGTPLRVKPFTLQTPHQSVYHQYPIDHLLSELPSI